MTTNSNLTIIGVIVTATSGSILGAIILYGIGMLIDIERLEKFADSYGHIIRMKKEDVRRANRWFDKYGYWTVLFCRMIPLVRSLISIPAGMSTMNFTVFFLFTLMGTIVWNVVLIMLGVVLGESWDEILNFMEMYSAITYTFIAVLIVLFSIWFIRNRMRK